MKMSLIRDLQEFLALATPVHVWSRPSWRRSLRHWPDTGRQQDAAEFLSFLRTAAQLEYFAGSWASLVANELTDYGTVCPVFLSSSLDSASDSDRPCSLHKLIRQWQCSERPPVFTAGTQCVALQLSRFHTTDRRVLKSRSPASLPNTVRLPVWVAGRVQQLLFHLCSALIHLGHTPNSDSGHYRAVLIGSDNTYWITDDDTVARACCYG